jgi:hypothetical protein
MTTTITPRPVAEVQDDIRRYTERLSINCVQASTHWYNETEAKLNAAKAELAASKTAARVRRDTAASLAAIQHIAPRVAGRGGAR